MTIENLHPAADKHSVQNVIFMLEWQGQLSQTTIGEIRRREKELKQFFPVVALQKDIHVNLQTVGVPNNESIGGVAFQRHDKFGAVISQLAVTGSNCTVTIADYTRWKTVLPLAMQYFSVVLPVILADKSIASVSLQYADLFIWKDEPSALNLREVLRQDSPYVASNIFDATSFWHSYHGFITKNNSPVDHERLDNMNLSFIEHAGDRAVQLVSFHRATLAKVIRKNTIDYEDLISKIEESLHASHQDIFKKIFTEAVCEKIGLIQQGN